VVENILGNLYVKIYKLEENGALVYPFGKRTEKSANKRLS
jgi:hypothetical protein